MVNAMLPELAAGLGTSVAGAAASLTWYMVPFSGLMLVSGTVSGRWGLARVVRVAFTLYAVGSLVCVLASSSGVFFAGRAVQGAANAFTTPLLLAMLADLVPRERLGRALGTYASMTAAGQAFAPLIGGAAAGVDYRWAFGASAAAAVLLAVAARGSATVDGAGRPPWRALVNLGLVRACVTSYALQFAVTSGMVLAALVASDRFGLSPAARGMVVAAFGVAGFLTGRATGRVFDRVGVRRAGLAAMGLLGVSVAAVGSVPFAVLLGVAMALAGIGGTGGRVLTNTLAMASTPANPAGATSVALAVQFLGSACAPAVLPLYDRSPAAAALVAGGIGCGGGLVAVWRRRTA